MWFAVVGSVRMRIQISRRGVYRAPGQPIGISANAGLSIYAAAHDDRQAVPRAGDAGRYMASGAAFLARLRAAPRFAEFFQPAGRASAP